MTIYTSFDQQQSEENRALWTADEARGDEPETNKPTTREVWAMVGDAVIWQAIDILSRHMLTERDPIRALFVSRTQHEMARGNEHMRGKLAPDVIRAINAARRDYALDWTLDLLVVRGDVREGAKRAAIELLNKEHRS